MSCSLLADNEDIAAESFAGWSFRTAIRPILGPALAWKYEDAVRTGQLPQADNELQHALFRFAAQVTQNPAGAHEAAATWLEPHFNAQEACALVAFAGAVRLYPSVFTVNSPK